MMVGCDCGFVREGVVEVVVVGGSWLVGGVEIVEIYEGCAGLPVGSGLGDYDALGWGFWGIEDWSVLGEEVESS